MGALRGVMRGGGMGFVVACGAALLVIGGLWLVSREGPSARSAFAPEPSPTAVDVRGRFGVEAFPTARPVRARTTVVGAPGSGLPRRRAAVPTAIGPEIIVGTIREGDATGQLPGQPGAGRGAAGARPSPVPASTEE